MPKNKYRIVTDNYCGFEVQIWRWWFPLWTQTGGGRLTNTHSTIEEARKYANKLKKQGSVIFVEYV